MTGAWASIDPGVEAGVAIWEGDRLVKTAVIVPTAGMEWRWRVSSMSRQVRMLLDSSRALRAYCEWPTFMEFDKGQASARSGALIKLAVAVGRTWGACVECAVDFRPVEIAAWKGQLKKSAVELRVRRLIGAKVMERLGVKGHAVDAVGIGLHILGKL